MAGGHGRPAHGLPRSGSDLHRDLPAGLRDAVGLPVTRRPQEQPAGGSPAIEISHLSKRYGGRKLRVISLADGAYSDLLSRVPYAPRTYVLYFVEGSTDLTPESGPILDALRKDISTVSEVQITGHTDTVGSAESNDALSRDRAVEIRAALVKQGLPVAAARTTGRGERELRIPTSDGVSEGGNRRVEVILFDRDPIGRSLTHVESPNSSLTGLGDDDRRPSIGAAAAGPAFKV
eukprot:gene33233-44491_t